VRVVHADLERLIRAAAVVPVQFAVQVPESVELARDGKWSATGNMSSWHYTVQVPTAVSLSFHAKRIRLPQTATLSVTGKSGTAIYFARDLRRAELWSRVQLGDTLEFTLTVPSGDKAGVEFSISGFQAGYRSLGGRTPDHPIYRKLVAQGVAAATSSCVQNYACNTNASNQAPGKATVAVLVENLYQCTGTLINDVPADNSPYVLTARHCESGQLGGGNPGAATAVTIYWNAVSACGQPLGSLYDPSIPTQSGASTVVEQQDAWLIRLGYSPVVDDAQFAGFDASGAPVVGGYSIHHAVGADKQYTAWYGQALSVQQAGVLGVSYLSNFLETVNQTGTTGPGASGSALFDQNSRVVGSLSLGRTSNDPSGYAACPSSPLTAPNGSNGTNDFTALAAVWNSTTDTTSSTGSVTLRSILDPAATGLTVASSAPAAIVHFTASTYSTQVNDVVHLSWHVPASVSCTASGGLAGDGWAGNVPLESSQDVTEQSDSLVTYMLTCQLSGGRSVSAQVLITWGSPSPMISATGTWVTWTDQPAVIDWKSNVSPCSISGGGLSLTNLPSSGSVTTTQSTAGNIVYSVACGGNGGSIITPVVIQYVTPSMTFEVNSTDRLMGEPLILRWQSFAQSCTPSGGAPGDGWNTTAFGSPFDRTEFSPSVTAPGTYTYGLTCTSGTTSLSKSVTVQFENNAPYVTASVDRNNYKFTGMLADTLALSWISNLSSCNVNSDPWASIGVSDFWPQSVASWMAGSSGTYTLSITCSGNPGSFTSPPIVVTVLPADPATASLTISPSVVGTGQSFQVDWSSENTMNCSSSGTTPPEFSWFVGMTYGSFTGISNTPGDYVLNINCASIDPVQAAASAQATLTIVTSPTASLAANSTTIKTGQSLTLTWTSTGATGCTASGGGADGTTWTGSQSTAGSATQQATTTGSFTYTLTCAEAHGVQSVPASVTVTVTAALTGGSSGSSGGGGGAMELGSLMLFSLATLVRRVQAARQDRRW
jgi:hypothetical protein